MKKGLDFMFGKDISLREINPDNNALKNEYVDNLMTTAMMVVPPLDQIFGNLIVVQGFTAASKLYKEILPKEKPERTKANMYEIRHTLGYGLCLTWEGYDVDRALAFAKEFLKSTTENVNFLIYNSYIGFYRSVVDRKIVRCIDDTFKIVIKE